MGDVGEMYRDWNIIKKEKKNINRQRIMNLINDFQIPYKTMNFEIHIILTIADKRIDVWPSTNKLKIDNRYYTDAYKILMEKLKNA